VEIAGAEADPHFQVVFPPDLETSARAYFAAADSYGTPAFGQRELEGRPQADREIADLTTAQALGVSLVPPAPAARVVRCQAVPAAGDGYTGLTLLHGSFTLTDRSGGSIEVLLGRFAEGFPVSLGSLGPGQKASLTIPVDASDRPWNLGLSGSGPVRLCTTTG
jgi:hypothetical protein